MWQRIQDNQLAFLGAALFLALVGSSAILGGAVLEAKNSGEQVISVTGAADKFIEADTADWSCSFSSEEHTLREAYAASRKDLGVVRAYLLKRGILPEEMAVSPVETMTLYVKNSNGNDTNQVEGYKVTESINVESGRVDEIEKLSEEASELIAQGIPLLSDSPDYYYTKLNDLKVEMLGKATQNAKARADSMARSTGNRIGLMRSAQMGVFQITGKNSTEVSDYGINDTTSRNKKVTAVVNVSFQVH